MSVLKQTMRAIQGAVILSSLLTISAAAQQIQAREATPAVVAITTVQAPSSSPLFAASMVEAPMMVPTLASADPGHDHGRHRGRAISGVGIVLVVVLLVVVLE